MITNDRNAMRRAKTVHINVRMTEAQRREVERRADDAGMAPSSYMRETAILAGEKPVRVADTDELRRIHVDLKRIGSNLNKAVRALNAYGADRTLAEQVSQTAGPVASTASQFAALLAKARG